MEIAYSLEPADYARVSQFVTKRTPKLARRALFGPSVVAAAFSVAYLALGLPLTAFLPSLIVFAVIWAGYLSWVSRRVLAELGETHPGAYDPAILRLEREGVFGQSGPRQTRVAWSGVVEVAETDTHLAFFLSSRNAIIVPKRAFAAPELARVFLETARTYWGAAHDGMEPVLLPSNIVWPPAPKAIVE